MSAACLPMPRVAPVIRIRLASERIPMLAPFRADSCGRASSDSATRCRLARLLDCHGVLLACFSTLRQARGARRESTSGPALQPDLELDAAILRLVAHVA